MQSQDRGRVRGPPNGLWPGPLGWIPPTPSPRPPSLGPGAATRHRRFRAAGLDTVRQLYGVKHKVHSPLRRRLCHLGLMLSAASST